MSHQILTYTELRKQIRDDLRIQHPEWFRVSGFTNYYGPRPITEKIPDEKSIL